MMGPVSIKGGKDGLRLILAEDVEWERVLAALQEQLGRNPAFFHGVELTVDTGERSLSEAELQALLATMSAHALQPSVVATNSRDGRNAIRAAGITTKPSTRAMPTAPAVADHEAGLLVQRTLRSGQVLRHSGHITLLGDVNPGAEIIASGSIVVWGRIRGSVHAGALGDEQAVVCALELMPTMLRIGGKAARQAEGRPSGPEIAHASEQGITVQPWEHSKR